MSSRFRLLSRSSHCERDLYAAISYEDAMSMSWRVARSWGAGRGGRVVLGLGRVSKVVSDEGVAAGVSVLTVGGLPG